MTKCQLCDKEAVGKFKTPDNHRYDLCEDCAREWNYPYASFWKRLRNRFTRKTKEKKT